MKRNEEGNEADELTVGSGDKTFDDDDDDDEEEEGDGGDDNERRI